MIKKLYLPLLMALVVALSSCNKKMGELSSDYFTTTPQVLEAVAGKVPVTINGKFPEKYFNKKAVVEVTPVLRWNGGEAKGQPAVFQGEKVEGNDQTISYKVGGNYTMKTSFDYVPEMAKSELYLEFNAKIGNKTVAIPAVKIADGVISTSELVENTLQSANPANGDDAFQRIIKEKHNANIMFLIQQANIRASELKTAKEFNKEVAEVNEAANKKISNIEVSAYASPDGGVKLNTGLAENRESNTTKMLSKDLKKAKVDAPIDSKYTAQDWEGFQELVSKSNIQDKELILRVLSMYQDPEQREQEIKNISSVYKTLADEILPQLRRSRLTLNYEIIGKSDDEIASLAASNPKELTLEELLYAATLTNDNGKKEVIYTKATELFPNDYRAFNNLGKLAYQAGNIDKAESYLKKAANIQAAPEVNMNLGLVALAKGDKNAAEAYLGKAAGAKELGETLGNLYIAQGQYERAVNSFGDAKTNSAALAQILAKDYNKAKNTLANIEKPDAYTDYLMAVLGARTNNQSMLTSSLKNAVAKDSSLAKKAATDLEFAKYFTNSAFMNIIK
ncbi:tetratricopeptide repeat protein [Bacteroides salyersiae]|uniref:tetratricopeptide repeat protein n=1 Tax=Bacteroides salyersiae TaxID=291644 RepID=UPI00189C2CF7|nr:tetratricopeptide repeat protein [Bacteroides salyersiae]MBT9871698.1 tetratricopeptide repeat protein [Bacteroides salyersiae]MCS2407379.1 tetratricopeptide repeat protein [Bacteroides salyersiae]QUT74501.1 Tetratricopeptide repeat protein [Bacteroides salyersiae]